MEVIVNRESSRLTFVRGTIVASLLNITFCGAGAQADIYPTRTVTLVVPFAPGSSPDIIARILGKSLADRLGKPVIVENRPGAGTLTAASAVAKASADGYTLLIAPSGTLAINPALYKKLIYDPVKDFSPVALVATVPLILVVTPALPVRSLPDLIRFAKERKGSLTYASGGTGTSVHLSAELLKSMTGIEMTHVAYRGGAQALTDVVAGHVHMMFADPGSAVPQLKQGTVRALGVSSKTRLPGLTEIPPLSEAGVPSFEAVSWLMIVAPAATADEITDKLNAELNGITATPDIARQIADHGLIPVSSRPRAELHRFVRSEIAHWGRIVQQAGIAGSE
jgi:tripartite-type tricarboxylate transporter receptor subunit TctC